MIARTSSALALAGALSAFALPAAAVEPVPGARLGVGFDAVVDALAASGWTTTKFEPEDGRLEVYAVRADERAEIELDRATGEVIAIERQARRGDGPRSPDADDRLRARLAADGWTVLEWERERGRIEVKAERDGRRSEIRADALSGEILSVREDDR